MMNLSVRRTPLQAFGWYLVFFLIGLSLGGLAGFAVGVAGSTSSQVMQRGVVAGEIMIVAYVIGLGVMLLRSRPKNAANIVLVVVGVALSALLGGLGGLIPLAVLTTRPSSDAAKVSAVFE